MTKVEEQGAYPGIPMRMKENAGRFRELVAGVEGLEPRAPADSTQLTDSTKPHKSQKQSKRQFEVHGGYTGTNLGTAAAGGSDLTGVVQVTSRERSLTKPYGCGLHYRYSESHRAKCSPRS